MNLSGTAVLGVGIDLCDVARIRNLLEKYGDVFIEKTFTEEETKYCQNKPNAAERFAARFAAKEAMAKALGLGISGDITLKSLSVGNDSNGKPYAIFDEAVKKRLVELNGRDILISLTHLKEYAQAMAVVVA